MVTAAAPWRRLSACAVIGTNIPETHNIPTSFLCPNACEIHSAPMVKDAKGDVGDRDGEEDGATSPCRHSGLGETHKDDLQDKQLKKTNHRSCINPAVKLW